MGYVIVCFILVDLLGCVVVYIFCLWYIVYIEFYIFSDIVD